MKVKLEVPILKTIKNLLLHAPSLRDNDEALAVNIWAIYHPQFFGLNVNAIEFFASFSNGDLISYETIRRTRQRVQEEFPETRGLLYQKRRKNIAEVKEALSAPEMKAGGTP